MLKRKSVKSHTQTLQRISHGCHHENPSTYSAEMCLEQHKHHANHYREEKNSQDAYTVYNVM